MTPAGLPLFAALWATIPVSVNPPAVELPTIVRIALGSAAQDQRPIVVPTEPENTVEVELPRPLADWAGRGFSPDPEKFAGDFVIAASRGSPRLFVTPVAVGAHRILHVVLAGTAGPDRSVALEFLPAPTGLAWTRVVLAEAAPASTSPQIRLAGRPPTALRRQASPESELGLLRTLRLVMNTSAAGAAALTAANPALELGNLDSPPQSFGDFTLTPRLALRDANTDTLALYASVANQTNRRLLFDPASWVVRVGDLVYPVQTVDFAGEVEPATSAAALLVVARGPDGGSTRLLPANAFQLSVALLGSANPRPVRRMNLEDAEP